MNTSLASTHKPCLKTLLKNRGALLSQARDFFSQRGLLEVDVCHLISYPAVDAYIDSIPAFVTPVQSGYLHTSPEYAMKRLLSEGSGDIYFLGHVFRQGEIGRLHNPEFTMAEWYRTDFSLQEMMQETQDFLSLLLGPLVSERITCQEAFQKYAGLCPFHCSLEDFSKTALALDFSLSTEGWDRETWLYFFLSQVIEPQLGAQGLTFLTDYPPNQAALSQVIEKNGQQVAQRFEVYYQGIELANGFQELANAKELRTRFDEENSKRSQNDRPVYPLDEQFLSAIEKHFPPCCGVSVGFDRAFMLKHQLSSIGEGIFFPWKDLT